MTAGNCDETIRIWERQRPEEHCVEHREHRGVRGDSQGEAYQGDGREDTARDQRPKRVPDGRHDAHCKAAAQRRCGAPNLDEIDPSGSDRQYGDVFRLYAQRFQPVCRDDDGHAPVANGGANKLSPQFARTVVQATVRFVHKQDAR